MSEEQEPTYREVVVTCTTEGCGNNGEAIAVLVPADQPEPAVICGVCGQTINDVREVAE